MEKIKYQLKEKTNGTTLPDTLGFGMVFTDHMFEMDYDVKNGWHNPVIKPVEKISLHPATMFIHYGQCIFEGLKAFRTVDNDIVMFRPDEHIARLNRSAKRMCIPQIDPEFLLNALKELVNIDKDWIPSKNGESLYIRPFMFGSDPFLGVKPATMYKLIVLLSPVGAYYPEGFKPVKILAQNDYCTAVRKGLSECKDPADDAERSLEDEQETGVSFTRQLWEDADEQQYVEEDGTINIFLRFHDEVAIPRLTGEKLPAVTSKPVIQLLKVCVNS